MKIFNQAGITLSAVRQWYSRMAALPQRPSFASSGKSQKGDTIVEVLIAILIVSSVLVAAYQATTHNTAATQDTQEHSQALQLAESQLEYLRDAGTFDIAGNPTFQCFTAAKTPNGTVSDSGEDVSACNLQPNGTRTAIYHVRITQPAGGAYKVSITWASLLKGQQGNVVLYYRPPEITS